MKTALYFAAEKGDRVKCGLCRHGCAIPDGKVGICRVRRNLGGVLDATTYGHASSIAPDPIEKKPLFHFMPGTHSLSLGSVGCNLNCGFCQNWEISQEWGARSTRKLSPEAVPMMARDNQCQSVSWTYNEPTMWYEFTLDASRLLRKAGFPTVYVTNGYIAEEPLRELSKCLDAMNIDVKAFTEGFYSDLVKGKLSGVLETCELAHELGIHIELTYLVIPTKNDKEEELKGFSKWAAQSLSPDVPVHFSRFHPDYRLLDVPSTPNSTLALAKTAALAEGLKYVYIGNIGHTDDENTHCPKCRALLVERWGFRVIKNRLKGGGCPDCGEKISVVEKPGWIV
ncbi:MAG: AmmeMemoRadiSam system radical SAM enzyme [Euryarchaeota archaeon]|nr:AmmeMemoRadiSam system radical SAM enzyme [Euryarchaeota archaeon]